MARCRRKTLIPSASEDRPTRNRSHRQAVLARTIAIALSTAFIVLAGRPARSATLGPCDIYADAGTPCVAAHGTTRALFARYEGPLYQVKRSSDGTSHDADAGGYAPTHQEGAIVLGTGGNNSNRGTGFLRAP